ncbi:MAG: NADP-dependent oxidoreductase [Gammaproteobacteria bacterium]|nr:NADP-dependent oxidoreductase [Gammaproteobacteria bacterium]MCY4358036.1 NADP-dependent oxidoreductase [Gammaproteobacteria bacterium]
MSNYTAKEIHLVSRPTALPTTENFKLVETELSPPGPGEVLIDQRFLSVDPYMRGRMREDAVYADAYQLNHAMYGGAIGEVIESGSDKFKPGDIVLNGGAWRDRILAKDKTLGLIQPFDPEQLSLYLGTLGMPGLTAYVGLLKFGEPKEGETVFVSAASGAVGANVCQIAKLKGCRVVGSVGSDSKAKWLQEECGVDAVINYKTCGKLTPALMQAAPEGIDVYFENVGGEHLEAAINVLNPFGRITACGMISGYNEAQPGPRNMMLIVGKKLRISGFIISDHGDMQSQFLADMEAWVRDGKIKSKETIIEGVENAIDAFLALFSGDNFGKMIVKI